MRLSSTSRTDKLVRNALCQGLAEGRSTVFVRQNISAVRHRPGYVLRYCHCRASDFSSRSSFCMYLKTLTHRDSASSRRRRRVFTIALNGMRTCT